MRGVKTPIFKSSAVMLLLLVVVVAVEDSLEGDGEAAAAAATNWTREGDTEKLIGERKMVSTASKEKRLLTK